MGLKSKTKRVLVIDDDLMVGRVLDDYLTNEGFEVAKATMAEEGYQSATDNPPDLIILDISLPDATGFQMCGRFRENPRLAKIPIIMVSGHARFPNQQAIGKQLGANEYILKPFDVTDVGNKVRGLLNLGPGPLPGADTENANGAETAEPAAESTTSPNGLLHEIEVTPASQPEKPSTLAPIPPSLEAAETTSNNGAHENDATLPPIPDSRVAPPPAGPPPWEPLTPRPASSTPTPSYSAPAAAVAPPAPTPEPAPLAMPPAARTALPDAPSLTSAPRTEEKPVRKSFLWPLAGCLFVTQIILTIVTVWASAPRATNPLATVTYVAGGWALMLGLLVFSAAAFNIPLVAIHAMEIVGLASVPIVLRSAATLTGALVPSLTAVKTLATANHVLPSSVFWMRPLDIFEMAAMLIAGFALRQKTKSPGVRCALAAALMAVVWVLTNRGFFLPF